MFLHKSSIYFITIESQQNIDDVNLCFKVTVHDCFIVCIHVVKYHTNPLILMPLFLQRLYNIFSDGTKCRQDDGGAEDLELGRCLQSAGVIPVDSRYYTVKSTYKELIGTVENLFLITGVPN